MMVSSGLLFSLECRMLPVHVLIKFKCMLVGLLVLFIRASNLR